MHRSYLGLCNKSWGSSQLTYGAQVMADIVNTYPEESMATFVLAKILLDGHETVI